MQISAWHCPDCKAKLFISNGGDYWCSTCQAWKSAEAVDPCARDWQRNQVVVSYAVEKAMGDL